MKTGDAQSPVANPFSRGDVNTVVVEESPSIHLPREKKKRKRTADRDMKQRYRLEEAYCPGSW